MDAQDQLATARALLESFNNGDWEGFRATLAPDVLYEESGTGRRVQGADAYVELCRDWRAGLPDGRGTLRWSAASDDTVALEVLWEGTHTGPLVSPAGTMPPSQRRISVSATLWLRFSRGRAQEVHHQLDMLAMLQQLGAIPGGAPAS